MAQKTLSELQENFTCLAIVCVDFIKLPLKEILDNHVKPSDLYAKLNSSTLITGNKLRSHQKNLCYITPPGIPDYSKFDVSLLYTLIRNLCPSLKPTGRWGEEPAAAHTQLGDDIERLRCFRNREFAHANSAEISDGEFKKHWSNLHAVINRIQSNKHVQTDFLQRLNSIKEHKLNCEDFEKYKDLLVKAALRTIQEREGTDEPDIWIEGPEKVVCGSTACFKATVKEKIVTSCSVTWQKEINNEIKQIDPRSSNNEELCIESVCKDDEGEYQAVLSFKENGFRKTVESNSIFLQVEGGILNSFYQDRGARAVFAMLFNEVAEKFPERKLKQLKHLIFHSCKEKDKELSPSFIKANSARDYFEFLEEEELFTPSDVIFVQFLLRESDCGELYEKCIEYATTQKGLCFYEVPPRNGYKVAKFHVQGDISNYTADQIGIIKETVAAIVRCDKEEIHLNGFCNSTSFFVVLSIKESCMEGLFNMKEQDKEKLISLNINYFIVDSRRVYLRNSKGGEKKHDKQTGQKIPAPDSLSRAHKSEVQSFDFQPYTCTHSGGMIAAIDFGTTFSGIAYATESESENYQPTIYIPHWHDLYGDMNSFKTPTTILLDELGNFVEFGFDAESTYAVLVKDGKHEDYFYFRHFKMMLYDHARSKTLTPDTTISDIRGRELPAVKVFAYAIKYLVQHLLDNLKKWSSESLTINELNWVITVPAIWNDQAKKFMRRAAQEAGISLDKLSLALEPEAVSIYCKQLPAEKFEDPNTISTFQSESKYLVLDAGGGTVDITVHEVQQNGHLLELERASGGDWGGISVDTAFKRALVDITTEEMIENYSRKCPSDFLELFRNFENMKHKFKKGDDLSSVTSLRLPFSFIEECFETFDTDLTTLISNSKFKDEIIVKSDRMIIQLKALKSFFQPACSGIINHVKELLKSPKANGVNTILMAGGFSTSWVLQEEIQNAFPDCQVIVPIDAGLAVLRGAVMFGFYPQTITSRIARCTYGVDMNLIFDPAVHDESKKKVIEGVEYCTGIFHKHIIKDQEISFGGASVIQFYVPITQQQKFVSFGIYSSEESNPLYTDSYSCQKLGDIQSNVPAGLKDRILYVRMNYGYAGIIVESFVFETGERVLLEFEI